MQYFVKISWKFFYPFSRNVANRHGFPWKKRFKKTVSWSYILLCISVLLSKGLNITPPFFQIVPCILLDLVWKFHKNPLMRFPVMLLTNRQTNQQRWKHNLRRSAEVITQAPSPLIWQRTPYVSPGSLLGLTMRQSNIHIHSSFMLNLYFRLNYDFSIILGSNVIFFGLNLDT